MNDTPPDAPPRKYLRNRGKTRSLKIGLKPMKPTALRRAREELMMSPNRLALLLRIRSGGILIRRYEDGSVRIPGAVEIAVEALLTGWRPKGWTGTGWSGRR